MWGKRNAILPLGTWYPSTAYREVAPVWWTPDYLRSRSPQWARQDEPTHLSSVVRWLIY
jgi:hypothetical protein